MLVILPDLEHFCICLSVSSCVSNVTLNSTCVELCRIEIYLQTALVAITLCRYLIYIVFFVSAINASFAMQCCADVHYLILKTLRLWNTEDMV